MRMWIALALAALLLPQAVAAQGFPSRQVTIVVTFPPGGNADVVARLLADKLQQSLKQTVIVENKPGAATIPGTSAVIQAPADGHTLLHADVPASNLAELVALAKSKPGALNYGSPGNGTFAHLAMAQLTQATGTTMTHVPFRGLGPAMVGLLRNDVQMMTSDIPGALEHVRAGKLRAIAHTGTIRMPQLPDLPTMVEAGVSGYEAAGFLGIMVRAGTPPEAVVVLNREINNALASPEFSRHIANNGLGVGGGTPADFTRHLQRDRAIWSKVIAAGGITGQ